MTHAPLSQQRLLIDLQNLDSRLARLSHERTHLPILERIETVVRRLHTNRRDTAVATGALTAARAEADRAEDEVSQVARRAEVLRERLAAGTASARDLAAIQGEIDQLGRRQADLEDKQIAAMETLESAQSEADRLAVQEQEIRAAGLVPELSVAFTPESLCEEAEAQVLVPSASLALRWPGDLPALVLDGAADLMHYPDHFTPVSAAGDLTCLSDLTAEMAVPADPGAPAGTVPSGDGPTILTRAQLVARVEAAGASTGADKASASRAVLVRSPDTAQMLQEVLVAWRTGRTAVVLTPEAGDDVAAAAVRQEGITEWVGGSQSR